MKTSLLLLGLVLGVGAVGTAQATDATTCPHLLNVGSQSLAAASTSGNGVLSDLSNLLSGGHQGKNDTTATDSHAAAAHSEPGYGHQPGPAPSSGHHTRRNAGSHNNDSTTAPVAIRSGGSPAPADANPDNPPTLGWQSLLPGSIQ
ncbi:MAG TPA: hypothetical protein VFK31_07650 [Rhodanobacteraceae bacterium]|nr:hypothetical protein [Rhodanobacteraceae bacterium]